MNLCLSYSNELGGHFVSSQCILYTLSDLPWGKKKNLPSAARLRESLCSWATNKQEARAVGTGAPGSQRPPFPALSYQGHVC